MNDAVSDRNKFKGADGTYPAGRIDNDGIDEIAVYGTPGSAQRAIGRPVAPPAGP